MREVIVFAEGPSEEQFIKRVVAPALRHLQVYLKPQTLKTSQEARGGAVSFDRLKFYARNTLRQSPDAALTTFLDLYALDTSFPASVEARALPTLEARLARLHQALHEAIVDYVGCRPERFIPYIQPHEFEGLLFSAPAELARIEPEWAGSITELAQVRALFESPEHINNGYETKPSRRLEVLLRPGYKKVRHGPLAAERMTLPVIEGECAHFRGWMAQLRALGAIAA